MACKMQPHSDQMAIIAREMALDICRSSVSPDEATHIPGIANKAADALSRLHQPGAPQRLPEYLLPEHRSEVSANPREWWLSVPHRNSGKRRRTWGELDSLLLLPSLVVP